MGAAANRCGPSAGAAPGAAPRAQRRAGGTCACASITAVAVCAPGHPPGGAPGGAAKGAGLGYTVNKEGKAVAVRRRTPDASAQEPRGDVRFRSAAPKPGQMLTQHTGLPPRAGVKPKGPGKPTFKAAGKPGSKAGTGRKPR